MGVNASFFTKFKSVITRVGSGHEGERCAAANLAFTMCEEYDLSFLEALDGAFGSVSGNDDLLQQIAELEDDNRKLSEAVNLLNAQRQAIPKDIGEQFLAKLWCYTQVRLIGTLATLWGFFWLLTQLDVPGKSSLWRYGVVGLKIVAALYIGNVAWQWVCAEFARAGVGVAILKTIPMALCLWLCVNFYLGSRDLSRASFVMALTFGLCVSNVFPCLAHDLAHSDEDLCQLLRSWFA